MVDFEVVLMRGLPGSGKSTYVNKLGPALRLLERSTLSDTEIAVAIEEEKTLICSADDAPNLPIPARHAQCFLRYLQALHVAVLRNKPVAVFVDNTNIGAVEMAPYIMAFNALVLPTIPDATLRVLQIHCDMKVALSRQEHNVPHNVWLDMQTRLLSELLPPWFPQIQVICV